MATTTTTTTVNPTSVGQWHAGSSRSTLAVKTFVDALQQQKDGSSPGVSENRHMDGLRRSLVTPFTADGDQILLSRKLRELLPSMATENRGRSRPAGLLIDHRVPQEIAGLCSSSATPREMHRLVIANAMNFRREDEDVARIGVHDRSDVVFPKDEELQNEGVKRTSDFAAAEAPDSRRVGVEDAALLAAGALLDLSSSLVDEGYNTSSIGSSTGNVKISEKARRKQTEAQFKLEPDISDSNDEDKNGSTKTIEEPLADHTGKRRRVRRAWTNFETTVSVGKKRSEESGESERGSVITTQAETTAGVLPRTIECGKLEDKISVLTEQQTSVLPRPAHRKRYRPIEKLMQETPVVTAVYTEDD